MKALIAVAALASVLASVSVPANALPFVSGTVVQTSDATNVGWRCGRHRHWSWRLHRCVWNWRY